VKTKAALPRIMEEAHASDRDVSARAYAELMTTDLRLELPRITAPLTVLFAWTPQFPMTPQQLDAVYAGLFSPAKGARTVRIPDSFHFIMVDQPVRFAGEVSTFLGA
jgi:pimeloyl-ACP methyl ester carboxylesterase